MKTKRRRCPVGIFAALLSILLLLPSCASAGTADRSLQFGLTEKTALSLESRTSSGSTGSKKTSVSSKPSETLLSAVSTKSESTAEKTTSESTETAPRTEDTQSVSAPETKQSPTPSEPGQDATPPVGSDASPDGRSGSELNTPYNLMGVILVNKKHWISENYIPIPGADSWYNLLLTAEAQEAFDTMQNAAAAAGHSIYKVSGYRSYYLQESLFNNYAARDGMEAASRYSARPGQSEHQTGLAVDIADASNEWATLNQNFGDVAAGQWLAAHSYEYGFILRYLPNKEHITGYLYEPWHFRYVGQAVAAAIGPNPTQTLEEYLGDTLSLP